LVLPAYIAEMPSSTFSSAPVSNLASPLSEIERGIGDVVGFAHLSLRHLTSEFRVGLFLAETLNQRIHAAAMPSS
jgi:hypothetical protein